MGGTHLDEIDFVEAVVAPGTLDVEDGDDVLMVEVAQELHLSEGSKAEHGVVEGGDLLDGDLLAGRLVNRRAGRARLAIPPQRSRTHIKNEKQGLPDDTVGTLTDDILNVILLADIEGDLAGVGRVVGGLSARHGCCSLFERETSV
jgi:hypothetical protein